MFTLNVFKKSASKIIPSITQRISGLDELRGIAVLWVMITHGGSLFSWAPDFIGGMGSHGVFLFFFISGFLITKILMDMEETNKPLSTFYVRRIFRIWPLMLLALIVSLILDPTKLHTVWPNLFLMNNYAYASGWDIPFRTDVLWSLAIEEQFYLFWPLLVISFRRNYLILLCQVGIVIGFLFDSNLLYAGRFIVHKTTHGNIQYIFIGCLAALLQLENGKIKSLTKLIIPVAASMACAIYAYLFKNNMIHGRTYFYWYGTTLLVVSLFIFTIMAPKFSLKSRFLAYAGKLCYSLYVIHFFINNLVFEFFKRNAYLSFSLYVIISFALAHLSYEFFEMPINGLRTEFEKNERMFRKLCLMMIAIVFVSLICFMTTVKPLVGLAP